MVSEPVVKNMLEFMPESMAYSYSSPGSFWDTL